MYSHEQETMARSFLRGVNLAGAEFGETELPGTPGTHFTYNSERSFQYFAEKGFTLFRLALRWERLQPVLRGPLDDFHLAALKQNVTWAHAHGIKLIIEIHNFGAFLDLSGREIILTSGVELADFWLRLSDEFRNEPAVYAYDLMNEPWKAGSRWKTISQETLSAIRNNGDHKLIAVPGIGFSAARTWRETHGRKGWIRDPVDNFVYEAHQYFDSDDSGRYKLSYDEELACNPKLAIEGPARLAPFAKWCERNGARGYLGEYGVPGGEPRWLVVLDNFLVALDRAGMDGTYWAAGEWWGQYPLSVQPTADFTVDKPQLAVLLRHLAADAPAPA
jgi:endoglucanase